jgi:large subunit ribosomal protein L31
VVGYLLFVVGSYKQQIAIKKVKSRGAIMAKPNIHPKWYPDAKVYCNGEVVMTIGSTQPEIHVDVWSGNHPFYTGTQKMIDTEGRVERFMRKYGMLDEDAAASTPEAKK